MATNTKYKLAFVLDDGLDKPDGVQQYILTLGTWLSSQGHEVHYIVGQTSRTDIPNVHSASRNISWRFNGNRGTMPLPAKRRRLKQLLESEQFDIVHVQVPYSPFMAHRLIKLCSTKTVVIGTFHVAPAGMVMSVGTRLLSTSVKNTVRRFDTMLSVSTAAQNFALQTFGVHSIVLPNAIDYPRFVQAKPFPRKSNTRTILFLGRLVPRKGCAVLLQAILLLQQRGVPTFRLTICGRGELEPELKKYVDDNGLQNFVEFVGFVSEEDKLQYYASADIAVFPSNGGESFGIVLLEAMASGKAAVLAGDNPGYRTVMEPHSELLFDPLNATELADKIEKMLHDEPYRSKHATWGRTYTADFDVALIGSKLLTIYSDSLQKRRNQ